MNLYNKKIFSSEYDAITLCKKYLKEESAVLLMWNKEDIDFEAYPSKNNRVIESLYENFLHETNGYSSNRLIPLNIKFKRKGGGE